MVLLYPRVGQALYNPKEVSQGFKGLWRLLPPFEGEHLEYM